MPTKTVSPPQLLSAMPSNVPAMRPIWQTFAVKNATDKVRQDTQAVKEATEQVKTETETVRDETAQVKTDTLAVK